jgi:hypothetical protein
MAGPGRVSDASAAQDEVRRAGNIGDLVMQESSLLS